eukprot:tig00000144_g9168.t1
MALPVIDVSALVSPSSADERARCAREIYNACVQHGFFLVSGHQIPDDVQQDLFKSSADFFTLPTEVKEAYAWESTESNRGYVGVLREALDPSAKKRDMKEAFNIGNFDCHPYEEERFQRMSRAKNKWPKEVAGQHRAGAHTDYGSLTLLLQDSNPGLEVCTASGSWISVPSLPGTLVVNTGDLMCRWTGGLFKSTLHRVAAPQSPTPERYSVAFFVHPNHDALIETISRPEGTPETHPSVTAGEYLLGRLGLTY